MDGRTSPKSWGEALMQYRLEKTLPAASKELPEIYRYARERSFEWKTTERQVDPILQQYIDSNKETKQVKLERDAQTKSLNRALDKTLLQSSGFNIINLDSYSNYTPKPTRHQSVKIVPPPMIPESIDAIDRVPKKKRIRKMEEIPKYDHVNGRYYEQDEENRKEYDRRHDEKILANAKRITEKETFIVNPISQNDPMDIEKLERKKSPTGKRHLSSSSCPDYMKVNDTNAHALLSLEILDPDLYSNLEQKDKVHLGIHTKNHIMLEDYKDKRDRKAKKDQFRRTLNKSTHAKLKEHLTTPYDIINNRPYVGINATRPPLHIAYMHSDERVQPVWNKIEKKDMLANITEAPRNDVDFNLKSTMHRSQSEITPSRAIAIRRRTLPSEEQPFADHSSLYTQPAQKLKKGRDGETWIDNLIVYSDVNTYSSIPLPTTTTTSFFPPPPATSKSSDAIVLPRRTLSSKDRPNKSLFISTRERSQSGLNLFSK